MRPVPGLTSLDARLAIFLEANEHAFTRADLLPRWTRTALERGVADGAITRILPHVYSATVHASRPIVLGEALSLWNRRVFVTGSLALHLLEPAMSPPDHAHIRVEHGFRPRVPPWLRISQGAAVTVSTSLPSIRCVTPEIAVIDAWRASPESARLDVLYQALWERVCTWGQISRALGRVHNVPQRHHLKRTLSWFAEGATSPLEVRARRDVFAGNEFAEFEWQVTMRLGARSAIADMLHRRARVVVELDGERYHSGADARRRIRTRDADLAAAGYVPLHFTWRDIVDRPQWCRSRVLSTVAVRLHTSGGT